MDLSDLNPQQTAAVTAPDGACLVVAGAGTGKTRTLVHRVAWLVEQGVPPESIVLLTFTRRAAEEMIRRAQSLVGPHARGVRGGTFHAFAGLTLRRHATVLGYTPAFTILDASDAESLVGLVRTELGFGTKGRRFPKRATIHKVLSKQVNTGRSLARIVEEECPQYLDEVDDIERIGIRYAERKRLQDVMDFDDLLVLLARLLREHPDSCARIAGECRHVLVDEYQDTNRVQAQIACFLSAVHGNVMAVGDEAQSIYRFRGAAVENILEFPELFPDARILLLEQNYRSTQPVLDFANAVLDTMTEGYDKRLRSDLPGTDLPRLVRVEGEADEPDVVVREILALREEGVRLQDIAVLFRASHHANLVEIALSRANLPFRKFGGIRFVEAAHVKDAFALLRLVANPRDGLAWFRVLQWFEGLGEKGAQSIADAVAGAETPRVDPSLYAKRRFGPALAALAAFLDEAERMRDDLDALIDHTLAFYKEHLPTLYEDAHRRERDLETLSMLAQKHRSLTAFLAEVSLDPPEVADVAGSDMEDEWLTLSTVHSAKGLEWHTVFVVHLADGSFPSGFSLDDDEQIEEERRLFYVACTRARRNLFLLAPRFLRTRWGPAMGPGCVLLDEIPDLDGLVARVEEPEREPETPPDPVLTKAKERMKRFLRHFGERSDDDDFPF